MGRARPLRVLLLGHGKDEIPPKGRGAVETIIWEYSERLKALGHETAILNVRPTPLWRELPKALKAHRPDWIFLHHERMAAPARFWGKRHGAKSVILSHRPVTGGRDMEPRTASLIRKASKLDHFLCLSPPLVEIVKSHNPACHAIPWINGADVNEIRFDAGPGSGAICLGGLSTRKRQAVLLRATEGAGIVPDIVGPPDHEHEETRFVAEHPAYRGSWTRDDVRDRLTSYACLVLYSLSEAQPLVVAEAMAAGLSVVLSPESANNVDASKPWVHIVKDEADLPAAIATAVTENSTLRPQIREHALERYGWDGIVSRFADQLSEWSAMSS